MDGFNWAEDAFSNARLQGSFGLQDLHEVLAKWRAQRAVLFLCVNKKEQRELNTILISP